MSEHHFYKYSAHGAKIFLQNDKESITFETHIEHYTKGVFSSHPYPLTHEMDTYYDVDKSAQQISRYILEHAHDEIKLLRAGYDGIIKGFKSVERIWGEELPVISKTVLSISLEIIEHELQGQFASI